MIICAILAYYGITPQWIVLETLACFTYIPQHYRLEAPCASRISAKRSIPQYAPLPQLSGKPCLSLGAWEQCGAFPRLASGYTDGYCRSVLGDKPSDRAMACG